MKLFSKRGSTVLKAPEEMYVPEVPWVREPAPAGSLRRGYAADDSPVEEEIEDAPYVPVRGTVRFRLRGILKTVAGKVVLGGAAFVALSAVLVAAVVVRNYLLHDARFVIPASANIETVGNVHLTRAQVLSVFGEDVERNIFKVPLSERRADLERLPWVEHATVMRLLPNTLRVSVVERTPVALVKQDSSIGLVDANGVLLDMPAYTPGGAHYSFPVLTGIASNDPLSTRAARMAIYGRMMKELDSSGEDITKRLSEVDVSSPEDVKVIPVHNEGTLVHLGDQNFLERYRTFEVHLAEWKQQYPKLASADMRYENQVVLDPGAAVPPIDTVASNVMDGVQPAAKIEDQARADIAHTAPKPIEKAPTLPVAHASHGLAAKPVSAAGPKTSAANAKMFAALAAARQQQIASSGQGQR